MPEKDGDEAKSTKSVVNKKQKQMMNTEEFSDRQRSDMKNLLNKNFGDESTAEKTAIKVKASRAREITGQSAVRDAQKYASGEYAKLGGGERMSLKMKGRGAATAGANTTNTGGPKENPKSLGGKSKGNTPVKVDVKKKPDMSKYFGDEYIPEEGYDIARDMGRVRPSKDKKDATTMSPSKKMKKTQKVNKGPSAFERVKAKYGKSVMNVGKKKVKEELDLTKIAEAFGGYIIEATTEDDRNTRSSGNASSGGRSKGSGSRTVRVGGEGKPRRGFEDVTGEGKVKFPKTREELEAKRKEYEIDAKGNITDRGVEKYARQIYRTNEPLTKAQLNRARQFAVGGKEIKDSKGNVIGKTTGKYGGRLSPKASEEEKKETQAYLKKRGLKVPDKIKPQKDRVTVNTTDTDKVAKTETEPEKGPLAKAQEFARKNPIGGYAAVELGKGIIGKLMKVKGAVPGVVGGTVGRRSARGGGGL